MRIARVLHAPSSERMLAPEPLIALERDGALYDVAALAESLGVELPFADRHDFHGRVVSVGGAGLETLDDALRSGRRPTSARILPGSFTWLPPCETERAAVVCLAPGGREPRYTVGVARGLVGHDESVAFPPGEETPDFELGLAAVLRDDLHRATPEDARRAILGWTAMITWVARDEEKRRGDDALDVRARDFGVQLGPCLVTSGEIGPPEALRARARAGEALFDCGAAGEQPFQIIEAIAYVSAHVPLRAGDVIGGGCLRAGSARAHGRTLAYDEVVEAAIERVGQLRGKPVRGPAEPSWKVRSGR